MVGGRGWGVPGNQGVYQPRVVLRGISPLIWRRLAVGEATSLAALHEILQLAFAWRGDHLHRLIVHSVEYGIGYEGGPGFRDDARRVRLGDLGLRVGERLVYDYDLGALWRHDLRVEAVQDAGPGRLLPRCTGGGRAGPPEACDGPQAFMHATQPHRLLAALARAAEIIVEVLQDASLLEEHHEELVFLRPWLSTEHFERRALNRALAGLAEPARRAT